MRERCLIIAAILLSLISVPGCAATVGSGGGTSEALYIEASRAAAAALRQRAAGRWDRASASYERAAAIARGIVQRGPDEPLARDLVAGALLLAGHRLEDIERRVLPLARIRAKAGLTLFGTALELASRAGTPTERIRLWVALARGLAAADQTVAAQALAWRSLELAEELSEPVERLGMQRTVLAVTTAARLPDAVGVLRRAVLGSNEAASVVALVLAWLEPWRPDPRDVQRSERLLVQAAPLLERLGDGPARRQVEASLARRRLAGAELLSSGGACDAAVQRVDGLVGHLDYGQALRSVLSRCADRAEQRRLISLIAGRPDAGSPVRRVGVLLALAEVVGGAGDTKRAATLTARAERLVRARVKASAGAPLLAAVARRVAALGDEARSRTLLDEATRTLGPRVVADRIAAAHGLLDAGKTQGAARALARAIPGVSRVPPVDQLDLLVALAAVQSSSGMREAARTTRRRALDVAESLGRQRGSKYLRLAKAWAQQKAWIAHASAVAAATALALAELSGFDRDWLLERVALAWGAAGRVPEALDAASRSRAFYFKLSSLGALALQAVEGGRTADAKRYVRAAVDVARAHPDREVPARALRTLMRALAVSGQTAVGLQLAAGHRGQARARAVVTLAVHSPPGASAPSELLGALLRRSEASRHNRE